MFFNCVFHLFFQLCVQVVDVAQGNYNCNTLSLCAASYMSARYDSLSSVCGAWHKVLISLDTLSLCFLDTLSLCSLDTLSVLSPVADA